MRRLIIFFIALLVFAPLWAQVDCYNSTRAQGISLMQQGHYEQAIQVFQSAQACPDKPENDDIKAKISECRRKLQAIDESRRQREEEARRAEERRRHEIETAAKGYMDITGIVFRNEDYDKNEISSYGKPLYVGGIKYVTPKISYNGLSSEEKQLVLFIKIFGPDEKLLTGSSSPEGFTTSNKCTVRPGKQEMALGGWGNNTGGTYYKVGRHRYEIWYEGRMLYSTEFNIEENPAASRLSVSTRTLDGAKSFKTFCTLPLFSSGGDTDKLVVNTDASAWFISSVPSWCTVEDVTADGFTLRCGENPNTMYRTGILKILAGKKEVKVAVIQLSENRSDLAVGRWLYWLNDCVNEYTADHYYTRGDAYRGQGNEKPDGFGIYRYYEGTVFSGQFNDGKRSIGIGIYIVPPTKQVSNCPGCLYFVGYNPEGGKNGFGRCYDKNGSLLYEGQFADDKPVETYPSPQKNTNRIFVLEEVNFGSRSAWYMGETENGRADGAGFLFIYSGGYHFTVFYGTFQKNEPGFGLMLQQGMPAQVGVPEDDGKTVKIEFKRGR